MTNIIYNQFLEKLLFQKLDIREKNTYKMALMKDSFDPDADDSTNFYSYSAAGVEVRDENEKEYAGSDSKGYKVGGTYISFEELSSKELGDGSKIVKYTCNKVVWNHITLLEDNAFRYALIYRESDGLLISCYDLNDSRTINNDTLILNWNGISTLEVTFDPEGGHSAIVDLDFSATSENALQNRTVTNAFINYGVVLSKQEESVLPTALVNMDTLYPIQDEVIDGIFDNE